MLGTMTFSLRGVAECSRKEGCELITESGSDDWKSRFIADTPARTNRALPAPRNFASVFSKRAGSEKKLPVSASNQISVNGCKIRGLAVMA